MTTPAEHDPVPEALTIAGLHAAYLDGTTTPRDVVAAILGRCAATAGWNVWITPPDAEALEPYLAALEQTDPHDPAKPLWGVPFAIKDNIDLAGVPTTAGCPAFAYTPGRSATVVERLIAAGAIPLGKTNLGQFATGLVGTRSPYGECHNALEPELISGGSSSGSAVAVALGLAAFALGTDTAGSGRVPAALNGLVGFKPPLGSWSTAGVVPACASLDCVTVFAHTLDDALAVDGIARGWDDRCAWSRIYPAQSDGNASAGDGEASAPRVICLPEEDPTFYGDFAERYRTGWQHSIARIRAMADDAGIEVRTMDCGYLNRAAAVLYDGPWVAERWADLGDFVESHPDATFPVTEKILRSGAREGLTARSLFDAMHFLQQCRHQAHIDLADAVLVMPTCGGTFTRAQVDDDPVATNSQMGLYTNHCNLCDLAAIAIPGDDIAYVEAVDGTAAPLPTDAEARGNNSAEAPAASAEAAGIATATPSAAEAPHTFALPFGITAFALADRQDLLEGFARAYADRD